MDFCLLLKIWSKYCQKYEPKKSANNALKAATERAIQKIAEETSDLVGNKIAGKTAKHSREFHHKITQKHLKNENDEDILKESYIYLKERLKIIDDLKLI